MDTSAARLDGKVALITGGSRGIGLATARLFLERGASVVITARQREGLDAARRELDAVTAGRAETTVAHSARSDEVDAAFESAVAAFGKVDVVVNNAATNPTMSSLAEIDLDVFDKIVDTNLRGYLIVARAGVRRMRAQGGGGAIVNVSTVASYRPVAGLGAYGISKAAVNAMTQTLAVELAADGIRVNGVAPGVIRTRLSEALWKEPKKERRVVRQVPLGRLGEPAEIASAIAFLASDDARYVTGQTLVADGGLLGV